MRDDFSGAVKENLARRVAHCCSRPGCGQITCGPQEDPDKSINIGVAAHITAAAPGGPRYDQSLTVEQRQSVENGIWLCQNCAKLIDNDPAVYTVELLNLWKDTAEKIALQRLLLRDANNVKYVNMVNKLGKLMPDLLLEMHNDLEGNPFVRDFVILSKRNTYNAGENVFMYYFEDHDELNGKIRILMNYGLVEDITYTNVPRYVMSEDLVDFLACYDPKAINFDAS